jgi:hypothetical protein
MSLRDLHLGFKLDFSTPQEQEDSEDIIMRILGLNCRLNLMHLRKNPDTPLLYESGIVYTPPDQADGRPPLDRAKLKKLLALIRDMGQEPETAMMVVRILKGVEIFLDIPALLRRGKGDCNELVPMRIAELWRAGIAASPYLLCSPNSRGGKTYHAIVKWPDGSSEDPSLILGMSGPERAAERREEIRKNAERWGNYMAAAKQLIDAEGASPSTLVKQIDSMGLAPRDGVFKSPYDRVTSTYTDVGKKAG